MVPIIDIFKCDGCGVCVKMCPPQVIGLIRDKAAILVELCEECGICNDVCPINAIHFELPRKGPVAVHECYNNPR
jgi:NAD-dependent dihydropyrimidine dehydrogenase PreA subunit